MSKLCFNHIIKKTLTAAIVWATAVLPSLNALGADREFCRGPKPIAPLSMFYSEKLAQVPDGTPLDIALLMERRQVEEFRKKARLAFFTRPSADVAALMENYTFLVPEYSRDMYGTGSLVGYSDISSALKYRKQLWRVFIEEYSTVKEAPSEDPDVLRFQVILDLSYFCRFKQRVKDLLTSSSSRRAAAR